jgi:hypothetical protein
MAYNQPPTRTAGVHQVTAADWNTYVRDNFIEVEARKESNYVEVTTDVSISATSAATATTVITAGAFTPDGSTKYKIEFGITELTLAANASGNACIFHLYENSTNLGRMHTVSNTANTTTATGIYASREFTPTNASKTYSIRAHRTNANCTAQAGSGGADVDFPIWMRITRMP